MPSRRHRQPADSDVTEELCLLAPGQLDATLDFARHQVRDRDALDAQRIADAWRAARKVYEHLEQSEAGAADAPEIRPLPKAMQAHAARLVELPSVRRTFDTVPVSIALVELDKLVVSQYSLTSTIVESIRGAPPKRLRGRELAELCLPLKPRAPSFRIALRGDREFQFVSDAHDMRFLGAELVDPAHLPTLDVLGHAQAVVALGVGFSTNLLNVVRYRGRVVLNNGHHRVHALRAQGLRYAPCVVQACAHWDDVRQAATSEICGHAEYYFGSPRPPLLRDFDNPSLTLRLRMPRRRRLLRLSIDASSRLLAL